MADDGDLTHSAICFDEYKQTREHPKVTQLYSHLM